MATTIRITNEIKKRLDDYREQIEKEVGAPMTNSLIISRLLKKEGL